MNRALLTSLLRFLRRELRAGFARGFRGFRIFLGCLVLGVAIIAGVGSIGAAVEQGLAADGKRILGGDLEFRLAYREASIDEANALKFSAAVSHTTEMRAMAKAGAVQPTLVELKAVDLLYPLYGEVVLDPPMPLVDAFARGPDGRFGIAVEGDLLARLGVRRGDTIVVGDARMELRAVILREPDRGAQVFNLGPRLMLSRAALAATGLEQPGSMVYHVYRVKLGAGLDAGRWAAGVKAKFPDAGWRVRGVDDAAAGIRRFIDRTGMFLNLLGLSALLIGGVGIANAVRAFLESRLQTLAILKCLGATRAFVLALYLLLIAVMSLAGVAIGLGLGAAVPFAAQGLLARYDLHLLPAIYPVPLAIAGGFGLLTAVAFSLPPLLRAIRISPAQLFRAAALELGGARWRDLVAVGGAAAALAALTILAAGDRKLAAGFVAAALLTLGLFALLALGLKWLARRGRIAATRPGRRWPAPLRSALGAIGRKQTPAASIVLSLGLGLTVLVAVVLIQRGLVADIEETLPKSAPSYYFIDIQPNQTAAFDALLTGFPTAAGLERVPMLRGRIVQFNGVPVDKIQAPPDLAWVLRGDRGITWAAAPPPDAKVVEGAWWPADYRGEPLVSLDAETAHGFGLKLGDTLTVNLLGRDISARIANLREIDWTGLSINFVMVFSPGLIQSAPQTHIATIHVAPEHEGELVAAVSREFPNVSAIRVKDAIAAAADILRAVGSAVRVTAGLALLAGMMVLSGAMAAGQQRRIYEAVLLKMLGGTRRDVALGFVWEFALLALATALIALLLGSLGAYVFLTRVMEATWSFSLPLALGAVLLSLAVTLAIGFASSWRALGAKAAPYLRND